MGTKDKSDKIDLEELEKKYKELELEADEVVKKNKRLLLLL